METQIKMARLCHTKLFALKNGAESINCDMLAQVDQDEFEKSLNRLTQLFDEYQIIKTTRAIPNTTVPTTSTMLAKKMKTDKQEVITLTKHIDNINPERRNP